MKINPVSMRRTTLSRRFAAVAAIGLATLGMGGASFAQTDGQQVPVPGGFVLSELGFQGFVQPSTLNDTPTAIDYSGAQYNYIRNPYMAVVVGVGGDPVVPYDAGQWFGTNVSITHFNAGMISFGNLGGSLRIANDDKRALNGFGLGEAYGSLDNFNANGGGIPYGYGVWPLPARWNGGSYYDYSSYVSARIDNGTTNALTIPVVGSRDGDWIVPPVFRSNPGDNYLYSEAKLTDDLTLRQEIRLFRNMAQMRWVIVNTGTEAHTVDLKFAVNERAARGFRTSGTTTTEINPSYYYSDPQAGPTLRAQQYTGVGNRAIPSRVEILGARYQADTVSGEPFHARHYLTEFGATQPSLVFVGDSENLYPIGGLQGSGSFLPPDGTGGILLFDKIEDGAAVGVYWLNRSIAPGGTSAPIVTYYGNGNSTDAIDPDFTTATDAEEAFQYNADAVNTLTAAQKSNPSLAETARAFLSPQQFTIYGSVYNRQLSESQFAVTLKDVRMSVTLPSALRFGINPNTGAQDVSEKTVGDIAADRDGVATWVAEPTGEQFGTYSYQLTSNVGGISPLSRTISRAVTIPATPLYRVTKDSYQMIGFPFDFDKAITNNNDASSILNGLSVPKDTNPGSLRFYKWVPDSDSVDGTGHYEATTTLTRGQGYFYKPVIDRLLFLNGAKPDSSATPLDPGVQTEYYQVVLERGWNMISNPFVYAIPASFISFAEINNTDPNVDLDYTTIADAVSSGLVRGGIFFYNTSIKDYDFFQDFNQELRPYQAYWIYLEDRKILRIATPTQKQSGVLPGTGSDPNPPTRKVVGAIQSGRAFPAQATNDNWKIQLTAKRVGSNASDSANDSATLIGVNPSAKDGDDSRDLPKPPPIVEDYVSVRVMHEVKSGKSRAFAQDMKAPGGKKTWDLEVVSDKDGPVSLAWPNLSRLPRTVRLTLTDKATNRKVSLSGTSSLVVNVSAGVPSRFVLTADKQASRPLTFTNVQIRKEPGSAGGSTRGIESNYSLSFKATAEATVEARILSLSGKAVATLVTGRAVSSDGITKLRWNGRAQDGNALPAGGYMVELSARTESGETVTVKRPIILMQ